jgi:hypothetical protein
VFVSEQENEKNFRCVQSKSCPLFGQVYEKAFHERTTGNYQPIGDPFDRLTEFDIELILYEMIQQSLNIRESEFGKIEF